MQTITKPMLLRKENRAAGELEGGKTRLELDYSHQKCPSGLFDERSEIFREAKASRKMWRFLACKKVADFFNTL